MEVIDPVVAWVEIASESAKSVDKFIPRAALVRVHVLTVYCAEKEETQVVNRPPGLIRQKRFRRAKGVTACSAKRS